GRLGVRHQYSIPTLRAFQSQRLPALATMQVQPAKGANLQACRRSCLDNAQLRLASVRPRRNGSRARLTARDVSRCPINAKRSSIKRPARGKLLPGRSARMSASITRGERSLWRFAESCRGSLTNLFVDTSRTADTDGDHAMSPYAHRNQQSTMW